MTNYQDAMQLALELALLGPAHGVNPQVGAVILDADNNIVSEGFHRGSGTAHAEVDALSKLSLPLPKGYTAVVTLEPCNHTGKTGPCAQALIAAGISRVVYAVADPGNASANGAETLRAAGVEVISGVLAEQAEEQNRVWLISARNGRPFVTVKWAESIDGRSAANDGTSKWISGKESREDSHFRRSNVDAILVGTQTAIDDDPELTARKPDGTLYAHQPLRVIIGQRALEGNLRAFNTNAETLHIQTRNLHEVLAQLWSRGVKHLWVEGGAKVASEFIRHGLADELIVYLAPLLLGGGRTAITDLGIESMTGAKKYQFAEVKQLGADIFIRATESKN